MYETPDEFELFGLYFKATSVDYNEIVARVAETQEHVMYNCLSNVLHHGTFMMNDQSAKDLLSDLAMKHAELGRKLARTIQRIIGEVVGVA